MIPDVATIRVSRILEPVTVLGPGRRVGLWTQGCTLRCPGCVSRDTWAPEDGIALTPGALADRLSGLLTADPTLTGLTVTGGEPFQQPALAEAIARVRQSHPDVDVLVYTGYAASTARRRAPGLWGVADAVITGRYQQGRPWPGPWAGSDNQELVLRTGLGRERLGPEAWAPDPGIQAVLDGGDLVLVGIPRRGDLDRLESRLATQGITMREVSWRP